MSRRRDEALENIRDAIGLWVEVAAEDAARAAGESRVTTAEVVV